MTNILNLTELCIYPKKLNQYHYKPGQALRIPEGWGSPISRQSSHEGGNIVSLTHRPPLHLGNIPGIHFCWRLNRTQCHSAAGRFMLMKNSRDTIDTIGNRTLDLPACNAVPQATALPSCSIYTQTGPNCYQFNSFFNGKRSCTWMVWKVLGLDHRMQQYW